MLRTTLSDTGPRTHIYLPGSRPTVPTKNRSDRRSVRGHPLILSTLEPTQNYLASPVTFIRLICAHLVKRVKRIYARLQGPGAAQADGLCMKTGILQV